MSWFYRRLVRPALFAQDAEEIHNRTLRALGWISRHELACNALESFLGAPPLLLNLFGLRFPNPVGLAAGMDKSAEALPAWAALGFGFTELGAVTWHPQPGNEPPRVFRAIADEAIVNRMGFNNPGAEAVAQRLSSWRSQGRWPNHPVGINLGKSKITPLKDAAEDYARTFRVLWPHADFFVVNVSSPNTPGLRQLQERGALDEILSAMQEVHAQVSPTKSAHASVKPSASKPLLLKISPDLTFDALDEILELAASRCLSGLVATNTTLERPQTADNSLQRIYAEAGGLSGKPLRAKSTEIIRHAYRQTKGQLPIIGVGGIVSPDDAWDKIVAGASLTQVYTSLVYEGPGLAKALVKGLLDRLESAGLCQLSQAIGSGHGVSQGTGSKFTEGGKYA